MAAAFYAKEQLAKAGDKEASVVLMERSEYLGGVLPQCIHSGFGTQLYEKDYTGGEYAFFWEQKTREAGVEIMLQTTVMSVETFVDEELGKDKWKVKCVSGQIGSTEMTADAVIVATGCRERTLPQMLVPGSRPAGIFTAGEAQYMMNIKGWLPGKSAVILGSGDIGLIMARRMTLEGIDVKLLLGQEATGLARNIVQCVEDFNIPMRYGWTVVSTHGYNRLTGVTIAPMDKAGNTDLSKKEYIRCDTLLVATGLIPEIEVCRGLEDNPGIFLCGNARKVHDLADHVTEEGMLVGKKAAEYVANGGKSTSSDEACISTGEEATGKRGNMVCTVCPKGCIMQVEREPFSVKGNMCERGEGFAKEELESPKRIVTSVVKTSDGIVSVRTSVAVDKKDIFKVMKAIKKIRLTEPIMPGQTVARSIAGTHADLIATYISVT